MPAMSDNSSTDSLPLSLNSTNTDRSTSEAGPKKSYFSGLDHINMQIPQNTLSLAHTFYSEILGLEAIAVPKSSEGWLAWFRVGDTNQTIHISSQYKLSEAQLKGQRESPRHPCLKVSSLESLEELQTKVYEHMKAKNDGCAMYCDEPGVVGWSQGAPGEFPRRFFCRDFAGNRLEFTL